MACEFCTNAYRMSAVSKRLLDCVVANGNEKARWWRKWTEEERQAKRARKDAQKDGRAKGCSKECYKPQPMRSKRGYGPQQSNSWGQDHQWSPKREKRPRTRHLGAMGEEHGARRMLGATSSATLTMTLLGQRRSGITPQTAISHSVQLSHQLLLGVPLVPPLLLKLLETTCTTINQLLLEVPLVPPLRLLSQTAIAGAPAPVQASTHHRQFKRRRTIAGAPAPVQTPTLMQNGSRHVLLQ